MKIITLLLQVTVPIFRQLFVYLINYQRAVKHKFYVVTVAKELQDLMKFS